MKNDNSTAIELTIETNNNEIEWLGKEQYVKCIAAYSIHHAEEKLQASCEENLHKIPKHMIINIETEPAIVSLSVSFPESLNPLDASKVFIEETKKAQKIDFMRIMEWVNN